MSFPDEDQNQPEPTIPQFPSDRVELTYPSIPQFPEDRIEKGESSDNFEKK
jgi:hypothetical protein